MNLEESCGPLDVVRYVLQKLEKQAVAAGSFPTLIHEGLEAEEKVRAEMKRLRNLISRMNCNCIDYDAPCERCAALRGGEEHSKHPTGDYCVYCLSQWPCVEAGEQ